MLKKIFFTALILTPACCLMAQDQWVQKADFGGTTRYNAVGFSIGDKGYIGTGYDGATLNDFWAYDPASDSWNQMADFPGVPRYAATGFSIGNKGYLGTGLDQSGMNNFKDFWEYDPAANSWAVKASYGGTARRGCTGFGIGPKGYIGLGWDGAYRNDFWEYDPSSDSWAQIADFGGGYRSLATGFSIGPRGYVGTGDNGSYFNDFWEYNPAINQWVQKTNFGGVTRSACFSFSNGLKGYIGGGSKSSIYYNDLWEYDPLTDSWTEKDSFPSTGRYRAVAFSIGGVGYIGTGKNGNVYFNDFWQYDPCGGFGIQAYYANVTCNGGCNGSASVDVLGEQLPYSYSWSTFETTDSISGLCTGSYTVDVTEPSGCIKTDSVSVTEPVALAIDSFTLVPASCQACNDGSISVYAFGGGTPPYTFTWSSGDSSAVSGGPGTYTVTMTDGNGCTFDTSVSIPVGINDVTNINLFLMIYPNPTSELIIIAPVFTFNNNTKVVIQIYNSLGYIVKKHDFLPQEIPLKVNVAELPAGLYFFIFNVDGVYRKRNKIILIK